MSITVALKAKKSRSSYRWVAPERPQPQPRQPDQHQSPDAGRTGNRSSEPKLPGLVLSVADQFASPRPCRLGVRSAAEIGQPRRAQAVGDGRIAMDRLDRRTIGGGI